MLMLYIIVIDGIKVKGGNRVNIIYVLVICMLIVKCRFIK